MLSSGQDHRSGYLKRPRVLWYSVIFYFLSLKFLICVLRPPLINSTVTSKLFNAQYLVLICPSWSCYLLFMNIFFFFWLISFFTQPLLENTYYLWCSPRLSSRFIAYAKLSMRLQFLQYCLMIISTFQKTQVLLAFSFSFFSSKLNLHVLLEIYQNISVVYLTKQWD